MAEEVTTMVLNVDLQCYRCYKKVKKILCQFPQIRDQKYDKEANTVTITVVCCNPEKIRDKICCKGGDCIISIKIIITKPPIVKKTEEKIELKNDVTVNVVCCGDKKCCEDKKCCCPDKKCCEDKKCCCPDKKCCKAKECTKIGCCCRGCYIGHPCGPPPPPPPCCGRPICGWCSCGCGGYQCCYASGGNPEPCSIM